MKTPGIDTIQRILLIFILLLAFALRLYRLDAQSLWNDEGTSVALAQRDLSTIARHAAHDIHPPLYYWLLHGWVKLTGISEFSVRFLSLLIGLLTVAFTYRLAALLTTPASAILAAFFSAISPFQIYYSQETRMYALAMFLSLLSIMVFRRLLGALGRSNAERRGLVSLTATHVIVNALALHSHYFVGVILLAQNLIILYWLWAQRSAGLNKRTVLFWVIDQLITLALFAPWLSIAYRTLLSWPSISESFSLAALAARISRLLPLGITIEPTPTAALRAVTMALFMIIGGFALWQRERGETRCDDDRFSFILLATYLFTPVAMIYLASLRKPMYDPKFLLLASPAYFILVGHGVEYVSRWTAQLRPCLPSIVMAAMTGLIGVLLWPALANLYWDPAYARDDYRGIVRYIENRATSEDAILINAPSQIETIDYYYDGPLPMYPIPLQRPPNEERVRSRLRGIAADHRYLFGIFWATDESDPKRIVEDWLDRHCYQVMDRWYGNLRLVVYATSPENDNGPSIPLHVIFGESIELKGYTLRPDTLVGGDILQLTLYWQALKPIDERYKVFVHLIDEEKHIVAQSDSEPVGGSLPTSSWEPGQPVDDNRGLEVPVGTLPGRYHLRVGLYAIEDGQRLPITKRVGSASGIQGDALELTDVWVASPEENPFPEMLDYRTPVDIDFEALQLAGYSLHRLGFGHAPDTPIRSGDTIELVLFWRRLSKGVPTTFVLSLEEGDRTAWGTEQKVLGGLYPLQDWREGQYMRDIHHVSLPKNLPPRRYQLVISMPDAHKTKHPLGSITLQAR